MCIRDRAMISKPGGDKIGRRRLDTHFIGIQNLGADFVYNEAVSYTHLDVYKRQCPFCPGSEL